MSLENKTLTELRGIAQAVGLKLDWGWDRLKLIQKIEAKTASPIPIMRVISNPPDMDNPTQAEIREALKEFSSVVLTFPSESVWHILAPKGEDSGNINMPLRTIVNCVKALL